MAYQIGQTATNIESDTMTIIQHEIEHVKSILKESSDTGEWPLPPPGCGQWIMFNQETGKFGPYFCGSARCPHQECKDKFWSKRVQRLHAFGKHFHRPPDHTMKSFTLTYPDTLSDQEAWDQWHPPWKNFKYVMKRKHGSFSYIAVLEKHKENNRPHIHGLTNLKYVEQAEWSERWEAASGAPVVWINEVKEANLAKYFSKEFGIARYFGKENMLLAFLKTHHNSIFASQDVTAHEKAMRAKAGKSPWLLVKKPFYENAGKDLTDGSRIVYSKERGIYVASQGNYFERLDR